MFGQREVQDTGLLASAVLTDHQPVQGVTVQVDRLIDHPPQSVVAEKGPKAGDVSVIWSIHTKWFSKMESEDMSGIICVC